MSADNWAICPACLELAREEHEIQVAAVAATYGKVPVEDFDAARSALVDVKEEDYRTFREDHEFYGAQDGCVIASYAGCCTKCGLSLEFKEEHPFWKALR